MESKIAVSVIMPVYNAELYLQQAIDSVLTQSLENFEFIIVDDGSTDNSAIICDKAAYNDTRVYVIHKVNGGICEARNTGIRHAKGEYITFIDNDDIIESDTLLDNYKIAIENDADWVKFGKKEVMLHKQTILKTKVTQFEDSIYSSNDKLIQDLLYLRSISAMTFVWDSLIRRSLIEKYHLFFDIKFKYGNEDIDFCENLAGVCKKLVINSKCYYTHFTRLGISTSSKYSNEAIDLQLYLLKKSNERYKCYRIDNYKTNLEYIECITKQLILPSCQKLNDAGDTLSLKQKIYKLNWIYNNKELRRYVEIKDEQLFYKSKKLWIYRYLFINKNFICLLLFDGISRRVVYWLRKKGIKIL